MAIGVLVEALLPGGGGAAMASGGEPPAKDEAGLKEWIRNKLKGSGCRHWRINLYLYGDQKIIILRFII